LRNPDLQPTPRSTSPASYIAGRVGHPRTPRTTATPCSRSTRPGARRKTHSNLPPCSQETKTTAATPTGSDVRLAPYIPSPASAPDAKRRCSPAPSPYTRSPESTYLVI
jgi:hypothetical protein